MKIVYLIASLGNSAGMERVLCTKANYLANINGNYVQIITQYPLPEDLFFAYSENIKIDSLNLKYYTGNKLKRLLTAAIRKRIHKKKLSEKLCEIKPDITVSMFGDELRFLPEISDGSKKIAEFHYSRNYLVHLINSIPSLSFRHLHRLMGRWHQFEQRHYAKKFDRVVLLTEKDKKLWGNIPNFSVIPNPVSFSTTQKALLCQKQIISIGRFIAQKGFDLLIEAFALIVNEFPDWQLVLVGEGQDKVYLQQLINTKGIQRNVLLHDPVKDIKQLLLNSSVYAFPSRYEGFGLVLTEAMECGVPCVAFDCECGPSEIITHNVDGFLIQQDNIHEFAYHMSLLMKNDALRKMMGTKAKQNIEKYHVETIMNKWTDLFNSAIIA